MQTLARLGFAAKGVVYLLIGGLTAAAAIGARRGSDVTDSKGALASILQMPFGQLVLASMAVGLFGYAAWRITSAITRDSGLAARAADLGKGLAHIGLGFAAARLVTGAAQRGANDDSHVRDWTATLLEMPAGTLLVVAAGLILVGYAVAQVWRAWSGRFLDHLSLPPGARDWVARAGRIGIAARACVFALAGFFVIRAALHARASEAKGFGSALRSLEAQPYGPWLLAIVALGLAAYGLFELAEARYRRIHA